ncbi:ArsR/SmtB family transcription factor [Brevibacillus migulae]|uniref:ArsR/SmtB family transcription factor n=1 Tax=Brevibacillus migulae TaxID=1644114 RepID=UPI00106E9371|nr:DUF5937 family protein [Brevibacillus migulae]
MQDLQLWLKKHVSIFYLPAYEFFLSLHVLANPEHHTSRLAWATQQRAELPSKLVEQLPYYRTLSNNFLEILDFIEPWNEHAYPSIEAALERIEALTPEEFIEGMIGPIYHRQQVEAWMKGRTDDLYEQVKPEQREVIVRPKNIKRSFLDFCHAYLPYFRKEERRVEPWLIRAVHDTEEALKEDPLHFLSGIHPRMQLHDTFVQFQKAKTYQFNYADLKRIYLFPSSFVNPHLMLGHYPEKISVGMHVDVPGTAAQTAIASDFIAKMKVFSDPTRTAILKSLLDHPYCIQQLADLHGITEPAVSKHIKLLLETDFIWSERRGRYVFYRGVPTKIERLAVDIHEFIDMPDPTIAEKKHS